MSDKKYTPENLGEYAALCKSRIEFNRRFQGAYKLARTLGVIDQIGKHWVNPNIKYGEPEIMAAALKCTTKSEFIDGYPGQYQAAMRLGIYEQACAHMVAATPANFWNRKEILKSVRQCKTYREWSRGSAGAYNAAKKLSMIDEIKGMLFVGKAKPVITKKYILECAAACSSKREFWTKHCPQFKEAERLGILEQACAHMNDGREKYKTKADVIAAAKAVDTFSEFHNDGIARAARRFGCYDQAIAHLVSKPVSDKNVVYLEMVDGIKQGNLHLVKAGHTSVRRKMRRVLETNGYAQRSDKMFDGTKHLILVMGETKCDARIPEELVLSIGIKAELPAKFPGSTEYRWMTSQQIKQAQLVINEYLIAA